MGLLSGDSEETVILLLIIMGVLLGLVALGTLAEFFLRKSGKRHCKPVSRKYFLTYPSNMTNSHSVEKKSRNRVLLPLNLPLLHIFINVVLL